ncbi:MAG: UDP-N-acetylmuramoyl-L-alanine--D-glutamate ligase [Bacteroidetes bacterium]|nr:MAG: UDP-N-acetylmuramoyl-L-alanine--D-glutamate ligase [Bacteroidota bacterium]
MSNLISILGAGESGVGSAILAQKKGFDVWVSDYGTIKPQYKTELDKYGVNYEEGGHDEAKILSSVKIIKSPGIADSIPMLVKARKENITIVGEIEFAAAYTNATLIGITGTNGKTTTTLLTHHILQRAGLKVGLAGNVGYSFAKQVAEQEHEYYVLELSSFQLDGIYTVALDYAVLLNITPDHLDRYSSLQEYIESKFKINQNQNAEQRFIYCADDETIINQLKHHTTDAQLIPFSLKSEPMEEGAWVDQNQINIKLNKPKVEFIMSVEQLTIAGNHNTYNSMAASIIANSLLIRKESIRESLSDFKNVEHRLEHVGKVKGINFVNDSKATNVNAAWYALESTEDPIIWIAGGVDKGNDYASLSPLVRSKVRIIVCLGKNSMKLHQAFRKDVDMMINASSAQEAVNLAYGLGEKGETVLLSPACASFDLFENYQDRGNQFKRAVRNL